MSRQSHDARSLVQIIETLLEQPVFFRDVLAACEDYQYREILIAWSEVRTESDLARDEAGRYFKAVPSQVP